MAPWAGGSAVIPAAEKWQVKGGGFYSTFSGVGTLSTQLDYIKRILSNYSGTGTLDTVLTYTPGTFVLDFSADSLGSATDYTAASGRVQLSTDIPDPAFYPGITNSLKWVDSRTNSDNVPVSIPVTVGPEGGSLSFMFKVSSESGYDGLRFRMDGVTQTSPWTGEYGWNEFGMSLPAGDHVLTWEFFHDSSGWTGQNAAWLAKITATNILRRPSAATGNGKRPAIFNLEDGAVPAVLSSATWTNSTDAPITGTRSMRTPALTEADSGNYDLVIDTSSLPVAGVVGFDLKWQATGGDTVSILSGGTQVWGNQIAGGNSGSQRFDFVVAPTTDTLTVRFAKNFGPADQAVWVDNLSIAYMAEPVVINSAFSGEGTLSTAFGASGPDTIDSDFSGEGTLTTHFSTRKIVSDFSGEGVLYAELGYVVKPAELGTTPLGRLASFTVSTSAVPLNPSEGSGAAPSVNAGYIKGLDPEFALGETNVLSHGAVGTYEGEIVRLSLPQGSDVATIAQDTALTLLNNELHLFPFIDAAPSKWTAARAIDYWSQQCGLFYDKVPGDCIAYASGFGHADSYGAQTSARFYEKVAGDPTSTVVLNDRSVKTLGSATTGTTAFHELPEGRVAVSVPRNRRLVASIGFGLRGAGRAASVSWNMVDDKRGAHSLSISATSDGLITAAIGGVPADSVTVPSGADYRVTFSIERLSSTAVVAKLTVHTDDLDGSGELEYAGMSQVATYALPSVMYLTSIKHAAAGGSGTQMLRWGTYLTVAKGHPAGVPAVQKSLSQTGRAFGFVSGFQGNVWSLLNEYCAITRQDIRFLDSKLLVTPRIAGLSAPRGNFSGFSRDSERREKYKQVAVVNKQSRAVTDNTAVLWRADSVYQVAAREVFETTVQTGHSILNVVQPVAVNGISPFPYKKGWGQYVVTGADGYIIAPQWWKDNGGKVEVSLTGVEGEIAIKITAPDLDTVRAPYRISEGEADRPALYISGSGILNDPVEVHVGTGAKNAREGFDNVFESPFIAGPMETYDTAAAMAAEYSASKADVSFELPNDFYTPSRFGQFPAGTRFTDGKRNYRITSASQTHSKVSGSAVPHTTIGDYVASYPPGATIADEKKRHFGRTIRQFNIQPLRGNNAETA
jgi:hypothetical protein